MVDSMCMIHSFSLCEDIFLMFSYHAHFSPLPFILFSTSPLLAWFFLFTSLLFLSPFLKTYFAWLYIFLHCSPLFFSLRLRLRPLLYVSQSRIPGTVIPLCAAQCERMFNTTRTPGEETGKETDMDTHIDTHFGNVMFLTVLINDTRYCLKMSS